MNMEIVHKLKRTMCPVSTYNTMYSKNTQSKFLTLQNYENYFLSIIFIVENHSTVLDKLFTVAF